MGVLILLLTFGLCQGTELTGIEFSQTQNQDRSINVVAFCRPFSSHKIDFAGLLTEGSQGKRINTFTLKNCQKISTRIQFSTVIERQPSLRIIEFKNLESLELDLKGNVNNGDMNLIFSNIKKRNSDPKSGYVTLTGNVEYCITPCSEFSDEGLPVWKKEEFSCNDCDANSRLNFVFVNVDYVLMQGIALNSYSHLNEFGGATFTANNVKAVRSEDAYVSHVQNLGVYADLCWRKGKVAGTRGTREDKEVSCSHLFADGWPWWYYGLIVLGVVIAAPFVCAICYGCYQGCSEDENNQPGASILEMEPINSPIALKHSTTTSAGGDSEPPPPPYNTAIKS